MGFHMMSAGSGADAAAGLVGPIVLDAAAVLVLVLTWLAARGSLPLNPVAGLRLPSTMRSPEAWQAGHRAALPTVVVTVAVILLASIAAFVDTSDVDRAVVVSLSCAGVLVLGMIVACVLASRAARDA
jgi:uncharacterized membrane protein